MRKCFSTLLGLICVLYCCAQLQSPEKFLGYTLGDRYTPHFRVVDYFQHIAANAPASVKLLEYGRTNEDRPLMVAFISTEENIRNLDNIRQNNLRLANVALDRVAADENAPAIVWLSYNVHGNETSSSEAAMQTIYDLVDPGVTKTKEWLKNTVIVIDPCINPDGRDRYVNWFNSVVGKKYNPDLNAREHREPWPGGRTNHYNFDLNRDWAWQTQVESRQRMKLYQEWLPQIHVDFHEQSINSPYYFAPAAQPYYESITPWQREFQLSIGKNNAKYFDANGWLFFTKEVFDLYYPSYGDTYPIYNGAVGMTYEQGGGSSAGLGVYKKEGDTLTLKDRLMHHYTTGMSTIEISSQNAARLVKEFRKFFNDAVSKGNSNYKTFVIRNEEGNGQRMASLLDMLDKNGIQYTAGTGSAKGYNYATGKEEAFTLSKNDIVISALQPKSTLIGVLFEPQPKLVDTATYDITAWALPYVYGLNGFAVKEKLASTTPYSKPMAMVNNAADAYGYVIPWEGVQSAKVVAALMQKGVKLRYAAQDFEVSGQKFKRGAVLVLKTGNASFSASLWKLTADICNNENVKAFPVTTGFVDKGYDFGSDYVVYMKPPKIALVTGAGTSSNASGEIWFFLERELNYPLTLINTDDLDRTDWDKIDVLILPDGKYNFFDKKEEQERFSNWIKKGGKVVALENAVAQMARAFGDLHFKNDDDTADKKDIYNALKKFENFERDYISSSTPGSIYKVQLDNSHPLAFGYPDYYYTLKMDDHFYEFIDEGWNVGVIKKNNWVTGFVGSKLKKRLNDGLIFGVQSMGRGSVVYLADDVLFRNFWQNGKLLFCNALFMVGQ